MKTVIGLILLMFVFQISVTGQCGSKRKTAKMIYKYVNKGEGIYLKDQVYENGIDKSYTIVLSAKTVYGIYLLNPSNKLPLLSLFNKNTGKPLKEIEQRVINTEKDYYAFYKFETKEAGTYDLILDFGSKEKNCVVVVLAFIKRVRDKNKK